MNEMQRDKIMNEIERAKMEAEAEAKKARRREQNRQAAKRYRERKRMQRQQSAPHEHEQRQPAPMTDEEKAERRRQQNREASRRYREKKRAEKSREAERAWKEAEAEAERARQVAEAEAKKARQRELHRQAQRRYRERQKQLSNDERRLLKAAKTMGLTFINSGNVAQFAEYLKYRRSQQINDFLYDEFIQVSEDFDELAEKGRTVVDEIREDFQQYQFDALDAMEQARGAFESRTAEQRYSSDVLENQWRSYIESTPKQRKRRR